MAQPLLFAIDIDGTLLNSRMTIDERTWTAIQDVMRAGHYVTLATGRTAPSALRWARFLKINAPMIVLNGGGIVRAADGCMLNKHGFESDVLTRLVEFIEGKSVELQMFGERFVIVSDDASSDSPSPAVRSTMDMRTIQSFLNYAKEPLETVLKVNLSCNSHKERQVIYDELQTWDCFELSRTEDGNLNINPKGITKFSGLETICHGLQIPMEDVVAFGNAENDVAMIFGAGRGYAMANAEEALLVHKPTCTLSNDESGVAVEMERISREHGLHVTA